jgi:uncharacterized membrane protein
MNARKLLAASLCTGLATAALAGGPLFTFDYENRIPYVWNMAMWPDGQVPVYTDLGALGILTNERANELVTFGTAQWSSVSTSTFRAAVVGDFSLLGLGDVDFNSVTSVIGADNGGGIAVIYDHDGTIMESFFGLPATAILGITNVEAAAIDGPEIYEAWMVLSGPGIHAIDWNGVGFQGVVTHEMGHALNLAHSQANGAAQSFLLADPPQPAGCSAPWSGGPEATQVETMYPFSAPEPGDTGEFMGTVDRLDDMSALSDLYPAPGYPESRATIHGEILDAFGNPVIGVNVIARNTADPFNDFSSYISGQVSKGFAGPDGSFALNDLTPGARYVVYADNLLIGAFSVPRTLVLPGPEEFFNGAMEGADSAIDHACAWTTVEVTSASPVTADIRFQKYAGAPTFLVSPANMVPTDMTPDGSVVVGAYDTDLPAVRWYLGTGYFEELGGTMRGMVSISDDGEKIAANYVAGDGISYPSIYENGLWTPLPPVAGAVPCVDGNGVATYGSAYDISGDGSTVVGLSYGSQGCGNATVRGFKWTSAGGTVTLPKVNALTRAGRANAVSYDGSVIVGWDDASTGFRRGVVWKNGTASLILTSTAQWVSEAIEVTRDGAWAIGVGASGTAGKAWRYNTGTKALELFPNMPNTDGAAAVAIADDSSVVTGWSTDSLNGFLIPAIWTSQLQGSNFNDFLLAQGVNTQGIGIRGATVMSADGRTLAGVADSSFGFVGFAVQTPTSIVCHVPAGGPPETISVDFPQGLDDALAAGDTLGPCACSTGAPTGIPALTIGAPIPGTASVSWTSVSGATGYDLARGSLSLLQSSQGDFRVAATDCLESALGATSYEDTDTPPAGDGFWYLVRPVSCGGHGTYDSGEPSQIGSRDALMQESTATCP